MSKKSLLKSLGLDEFVALDIETTGLDSSSESIIELSAVRFKDGIQEDIFSHLLDPGKTISPFIEDLTGISNNMVKGKPVFTDILENLASFIGESPVVGHNIKFDINFIKVHSNDKLNLTNTNIICDTYLLSKFILFSNNEFSLESISEYYNLSTEGSHRATNDAVNSGEILIKLLKEFILMDSSIIKRIDNIFLNRPIPNSHIINLAYRYSTNHKNSIPKRDILFHKSHYNHIPKIESRIYSSEEIMGLNGTLYENGKYKFRESQYKMTKSIEQCIRNKQVSIIEAGTGLGKTYAYLVPFIISSTNNKTPLVISTFSKALQNQLFNKDLKNIIKLVDVECRAIMLKGRNNYLCLNRLNKLESNANELVRDFECHDLAALIMLSSKTKSGDIEECASFSIERRARLWNLIKSDTQYCGKNCGKNNGCYYSDLILKIKDSDIIIVNHALLVHDSIENRNLLPKEHLFVIDEAHDLFKASRDLLTWSIDRGFFNDYLLDFSMLIKTILTNKSSDQIINILAMALMLIR